MQLLCIYALLVNIVSKLRNLMFSKMRLAPVTSSRGQKGQKCKDVTLPRLELLAVLIGVHAGNFVTKELKLPISKRILWTNSECVLHRMKTTKPLPLFVENRITEIRKEKVITFCYIPSNQNPVDYATRGFTVPEIVDTNLWWHGPGWLISNEVDWLFSRYHTGKIGAMYGKRWETRLTDNI